jgi:hypothetical protein
METTMKRCFLIALALNALSCEAEQPATPIAVSAAAPTQDGFTAAGFTCCTTRSASEVVVAYDGLGEALASDNVAKANASISNLGTALESLVADGVASATTKAAGAQMQGAMANLVGKRSSLEDLRAHLPDIYTGARALVDAGLGGDDASGARTYAIAFCPMDAGRWLQSANKLANPYYGASMLRCGVFEGR